MSEIAGGKRVCIGIRYCGGCNPAYDRVKAAQELKDRFPWIEFTASCQEADVSCILCGCFSACAETGDITGMKIYICREADIYRAQEQIAGLFPEERELLDKSV